MSPYEQKAEQQYLARLQKAIAAFATRYQQNPSERRTTIFLFPGGLASQLVRARQSADRGPPFSYQLFWLDCSFLFGGVSSLRIDADADAGRRFMLPDGYVDLPVLKPYDGFANWCAANAIDVFVVGWDWRRSAKEAADFFLDKLLPAFEAGVAGCNPPPLDNFWLVGHSFGGIVAKHVLNRADSPYVKRLKGAITVGTPFYGYGGQLHRFFVGELDLNLLEGLNGAADVTRIGSSLPASYELLFMDGATYDANKASFAADPQGYALTDYPSMDAAIAGQRADAYNPSPGKPATPPQPDDYVRYLPDYGFDWNLLSSGYAAAKAVSKPLDASVAGKLWNIRGVQTDNNDAIDGTVVGHTWSRVPASYVPDILHDPIDDIHGPGDGVIAAWSARLLGNPNVITIADDQVDHMDLMNHGPVQAAIADILAHSDEARQQMAASAATVKFPTAHRDLVDEFGDRLKALEIGLTSAARKLAVQAILRDVTKDDDVTRHLMHARLFMDALKSPSQKLKRGGR